jgi:TolB protein
MGSRWLLAVCGGLLIVGGDPVAGALAGETPEPGILFASKRDGGGLFRMDAHGGSVRKLLGGPFWVAPSVSPDGTRIAVMGVRDEDAWALEKTSLSMHFLLYVMDVEGKGISLLTRTPVAVDTARWSPDGTRIAFNSSFEDERNFGKDGLVSVAVYSIDATGRNEKRLTAVQGLHCDPLWSPDGKRLLFTSKEGPVFTDPANVFVMGADGGALAQVTHEEKGVFSPIWSPDGKSIAFQAVKDLSVVPTPTRIVVVDADGSNRRVVADVPGKPVAWTPDGKSLILEYRNLQLLDLKTGKASDLTQESDRAGRPVFSPEGKGVLFSSFRSGNSEIYSAVIRGGAFEEVKNLTNNPASDGSPCWVPVGRAMK